MIRSQLDSYRQVILSCMDAGSAVVPADEDACSDYDVRLVGGNSSYMGRAEACYTNSSSNSSLWGPLCITDTSTWTVGHAVTVCRQLGFSATSNYNKCVLLCIILNSYT